jgi:type IV secretion system protein VirB3
MLYLSLLIGVVLLGFMYTGSFIFLIVSGGVGYGLLRSLAAYDPKLVDVIVAACRSTPMNFDLFTKKGMTYSA